VNVEFRASFAKDLKNISNKDLLKRVRETIEKIELAHSLQDISGLKKLKGASKYFRIRVGEYRIGLMLKGDTFVFVRCLDRKEIYRYFP
jgi:mRNA interferase RelE/StbE